MSESSRDSSNGNDSEGSCNGTAAVCGIFDGGMMLPSVRRSRPVVSGGCPSILPILAPRFRGCETTALCLQRAPTNGIAFDDVYNDFKHVWCRR